MSWLDGLRHRIDVLLHARREAREHQEEMQFHLDRETESLLARGYDARDARREARRRFGGRDAVSEAVRDESGTRFIDDLIRDTRYGLRQFTRSPGFAVIAVVTMGLGVGAATSVFSLVNGILLRPLPWRDAGRLVELREVGAGRVFWPSYPNFDDWRTRARTFAGMASVTPSGTRPVLAGAEPATATTMRISRELLDVLGVSPVLGREFTADETRPGGPAAVLVSQRFWRSQLGAVPDLSSIDLRVSGVPQQVVGVLPDGFRLFWEYAMWDADVYVPLDREPDLSRGSHGYRVIARLDEGVPVERARSEMAAVMSAMRAEYGSDVMDSVRVTPLADVVLGSQRRPFLLLVVAALAVLVVACTNLAGTLLARGQGRTREMSIRASLGAGRSRLVRQLLAEGVMLSVGGAILGVLIAWICIGIVHRIGPPDLPRLLETGVDVVAFVFALGIAMTSGLLLAVWPSLRVSRSRAAHALRSGDRSASASLRPWNVLMTAEVALSLVVLAISALLLRSLAEILRADVGFDPHDVLVMEVAVPNNAFSGDEARMAFWSGLSGALESIPGVVSTGLTSFDPFDASAMSGQVTLEAADPASGNLMAGWRIVDPGYLRTLRATMRRGRPLVPSDVAGGEPVTVINEAMAKRLWPGQDAIGKRLRNSIDPRAEWLEVVGVVAEVRPWNWTAGTQYEMYVPYVQRPEQSRERLTFVLRTSGDPSAILPAVRARLRTLRSDVPATYTTLDARFGETVDDHRTVASVLTGFGVVALLLCVVGIYGVVSYTVASRTREIGIRIALGENPAGAARRVQAGVLGVIGIGCVAGLGLAFLTARLARTQIYGIATLDPVSFGLAVAVLVATAFVAAWIPARRSTQIDPLIAMRAD